MVKKTAYTKPSDWSINYSEREEAVLRFLQVLVPPLRAAVLFDKRIQFFSFLGLRLAIFLAVFYITKATFSSDLHNPYFIVAFSTVYTFFAYLLYSTKSFIKKIFDSFFGPLLAPFLIFFFMIMLIGFVALEFLLATFAFYLYLLDIVISFVSLALSLGWFKI